MKEKKKNCIIKTKCNKCQMEKKIKKKIKKKSRSKKSGIFYLNLLDDNFVLTNITI